MSLLLSLNSNDIYIYNWSARTEIIDSRSSEFVNLSCDYRPNCTPVVLLPALLSFFVDEITISLAFDTYIASFIKETKNS